jgi:neural Wiskott-Aldrich syndrome protein
MACTSRLYRGVPPGVRVGERASVEVGNYKWVLPDNVEEWQRCEEEWRRRFTAPALDTGQSSKYWPASNTEPQRSQEERKQKSPSKAELVRDKVRSWQANIISETDEAVAKAKETTEAVNNMSKNSGDVAIEIAPRMKQSPIPFPVVKPSVSVGNKTDKARTPSVIPAGVPSPLPSVQLLPQTLSPKPIQSPKLDPICILDVSETVSAINYCMSMIFMMI